MNIRIFSTFSKYKIHILLFFLGLLLFSLPSILRFYFYGIDDIIGFPTYMHERITSYMIDGTFNFYDQLSFGGRPYVYPPFFSYLMAFFSLFAGLKLGGVLFVSFFGGLGLVAFYMIAKQISSKNAFIATLIFATIPGTIFLYSHVSTRAVPITIALFSLYFFMKDCKKYWIHSSILLGMAAIFHPEVAVVFFVFMLIYSLYKKSGFRTILYLTALTAAISALWYVPFFISNGLPSYNGLYEEYRDRDASLESPDLGTYFWEFEGKGHITFIAGILAVIGFIKTDKRILKYWALFAFALTLVFERFFLYFPFVIAMLSIYSIGFLQKNKYKKILAFIIIAYVLFFAASRIDTFARDWPSNEQINAMRWISQNTQEDSVILSDWTFGHWIAGIADRKNFMDGFAEYAPNVDERLDQMREFYSSCKIPEGYGINYIYMEDWLIKKNKNYCIYNFTMVYNNSYIYVFKV